VGFLQEMVRSTREAIARGSYLARLAPPRLPHRRSSMVAAIRGAANEGALLVEFKRVSPGSSTPQLPTYSAEEFVRRSEPGGVAAYSCLASVPRFDGSPQDVLALADATPRPVLFKDFVVDPIQLDAAVMTHAAAVLLIARLETAGLLSVPLAELSREAHARGLEVLLEFHDRSELSPTTGVAAEMFGVNVRDLDSLRMEPDVAFATLGAIAGQRPLLGLSGVESPKEAVRFWEAGVDGILVGSAVARSDAPGAFLRSLHRPRAPEGR
jgi:indole-3-glycerol phosphate synthase